MFAGFEWFDVFEQTQAVYLEIGCIYLFKPFGVITVNDDPHQMATGVFLSNVKILWNNETFTMPL